MATRIKARSGMTLEEFLAWPRIDEKPYLEFAEGRIEAKMSPQPKHSLIQLRMTNALNAFAEPLRLGFAFPELRCTFAGRSIVPDVVFLRDEKIRSDEQGEIVEEVFFCPDIHVEVRSPGQSIKKLREKLTHSVSNGCPLGWFIDPDRHTVDVFRTGEAPLQLAPMDILDGSPVLPGLRITVSEVFGWLVYRVQRPGDPGTGTP